MQISLSRNSRKKWKDDMNEKLPKCCFYEFCKIFFYSPSIANLAGVFAILNYKSVTALIMCYFNIKVYIVEILFYLLNFINMHLYLNNKYWQMCCLYFKFLLYINQFCSEETIFFKDTVKTNKSHMCGPLILLFKPIFLNTAI